MIGVLRTGLESSQRPSKIHGGGCWVDDGRSGSVSIVGGQKVAQLMAIEGATQIDSSWIERSRVEGEAG